MCLYICLEGSVSFQTMHILVLQYLENCWKFYNQIGRHYFVRYGEKCVGSNKL